MAKYGPKAQEKVEKVMRERKRGTLRSGSGRKVTSRKQAIAIGLSEARHDGGKVPSPRKSKSATTRAATAPTRTTAGKKKGTARKQTKKAPASTGRSRRGGAKKR